MHEERIQTYFGPI